MSELRGLQPPLYLTPDVFATTLGAADGGRCGWVTPFILGAVTLYAAPPFLSGLFSGAAEELRGRRRR